MENPRITNEDLVNRRRSNAVQCISMKEQRCKAACAIYYLEPGILVITGNPDGGGGGGLASKPVVLF